VEGQLTGKEEWGGIQVVVYEPKLGKFPNRSPRRSIMYCDFNIMSSSMGIAAGGKMKQEIYPDPHGFDTWDPENFGRLFVHIVNSEMYREITGMAPPPTPISARAYTDCGLPWFDLYGSDLDDLPPAKEFAKVKTVKGIDEGKGLEGAQDDDPVDVPPETVVNLWRAMAGDGKRRTVSQGDKD
jgi:hypothetical protein